MAAGEMQCRLWDVADVSEEWQWAVGALLPVPAALAFLWQCCGGFGASSAAVAVALVAAGVAALFVPMGPLPPHTVFAVFLTAAAAALSLPGRRLAGGPVALVLVAVAAGGGMCETCGCAVGFAAAAVVVVVGGVCEAKCAPEPPKVDPRAYAEC